MRLICINCPKGCSLTIDEQLRVSGNECGRGRDYAIAEVTNPTRIVTGLVSVEGQRGPLSVKTLKPVPKDKIFEVLNALRNVTVRKPVRIGQEIIPNIVATTSIK